jgi:hypothetical protein
MTKITGTMLLVIAVTRTVALAAGNAVFEIPGHGKLEMVMPEAWQVQTRSMTSPASRWLHVTPKEGGAFDIQLTSVWLDQDSVAKVTPQSLRTDAEDAGKDLLSHSTEKVLKLKSIQREQCVGWYFSLTDRKPKPGEFGYVTQGTFLTGSVLSMFTILHREPNAPEVVQAIDMLSGAGYSD